METPLKGDVEKMRESEERFGAPYRFTTARRTLSETDIVNFVNLVGLYEPIFIDMEFAKNLTPHGRRFAPGPLIIAIGMGLVAPNIAEILAAIISEEVVGICGGMVGLKARLKAPVFPGDTLRVDGEGTKRKTSEGYTLVDIKHVVKNQRDEVTVEFTETVIFLPA